jgi:hypothetical protein
MTRTFRWPLVTACAVLTASLAGAAQAQAQASPPPALVMDDEWHYLVAPYFWASGISGNVSVGDFESASIDASFSDVIQNFDFGLQGHFEARKGRWGFGLDLSYINLGVPVGGSLAQALDANVDVRQLMAEGLGFYRAAHGGRADNPAYLDVIVGTRYTGTRTRLQTSVGDSADSTPEWVDALAGLRFHAPLGSRFSLLGRGDIAGFGSKLTWTLEGDIAARLGERWLVGVGWKHMDIDYQKDEGRAIFNVAYDGPRFWFAHAW